LDSRKASIKVISPAAPRTLRQMFGRVQELIPTTGHRSPPFRSWARNLCTPSPQRVNRFTQHETPLTGTRDVEPCDALGRTPDSSDYYLSRCRPGRIQARDRSVRSGGHTRAEVLITTPSLQRTWLSVLPPARSRGLAIDRPRVTDVFSAAVRRSNRQRIGRSAPRHRHRGAKGRWSTDARESLVRVERGDTIQDDVVSRGWLKRPT